MLSILFLACRTDDLLTLKNSSASIIDSLAVSEFILQEPESGQNPLAFTVTWTETKFVLSDGDYPGPVAPIRYALEMDKKGNNFQSPIVLTSTMQLNANVFVKDINGIILSKFNSEDQSSIEFDLRIMAYYGENQVHSLVSENLVSISVVPYKPVDVIPAVYLIGDMNGWNNTNTDFVMYRNTNSKDDYTYHYTGRLAANTYYKFIPEEALGTYKAYCIKDDVNLVYEESGGGAFFNAEERYVSISIDIKALTYSIIDFDVTNVKTFNTIGPIGGFVNWDNEPPMTKSSYDEHQWSGIFDIGVSTALKFRANKDWGNNWGGNADEHPYGKAVFDGPGADISVPGKYKINFNDLTGHYIIVQQ